MAETKILEVNGKKFSVTDVTDTQIFSQDPKSSTIDNNKSTKTQLSPA